MEAIMPDKPTLSGFRFFSEVPPEALETIEAACKIVDLPDKAVVFRPGDPADTLYCLVEGEVELSLEVHDKHLKADVRHEESVHARMVDHIREIVVDTVRSGQVFGWTALTGAGKRAVIARSARATRVCALPAAELKAMIARDHTLGYLIYMRLAEIVAKRLNARTDLLLEAWVEAFGASKVTPQ
jgi:CRP-like cAMP-binding protein